MGRVVEALALAPSFAFVIIVGPDEHPHLARWLLLQALRRSRELAGLEVMQPMVLQEGLELTEVVAAAATPPVVFLYEPTHLCQGEREEQLSRLNLQRDALGELPLRLVYWCTRRGMEELRRFAPDLVHWRSLLQVIEPADLSVATLYDYLAWCLDTYEDEHPSNSEQTIHLPRDPFLVELRGGQKEVSGFLRLSVWVERRPCGVVVHSTLLTARQLVSPLARHYSLRAGRGERVPLPVVVEKNALDALLTGHLVPPALQRGVLPWWTSPEGVIVFVLLASDSAVHDPRFDRLRELGAKVFLFTSVGDAVPNDDWPLAGVAMTFDPFADSTDPLLVAARGLADLLESLFERSRLERFASDELSSQPSEGITVHSDGELRSLRLLQLDNKGTWGPLSRISERIAAALITTGRVDNAFFARLRALRPRARSEIERVEELFRRIPPHGPPATSS
ncbi:MAG: hypothetical protein KC420_07335, partial [Myxococcales bacterium]|nr:hypothetical protein [Myxococcales bacterium]